MSVRNSFAYLDDSGSDEDKPQPVKPKATAAAASPPARTSTNRGRRDGDRRGGDYNRERRDNRRGDRRDNRRGGGEYNRDIGDTNSREYRRQDRRTDRRRDADRRDRRRDGMPSERRGRNQYEKAHQKRGPKKAGHGGWGTDKDAVDVVEENAAGDAAEATVGTEETEGDAPPAPPSPAPVQELTLEEHEAAEKERRAKFNQRWGSSKPSSPSSAELAKDFSGMSVVSKKTRKLQTETWASKRKNSAGKASKSSVKAKELKKAIFAEPRRFPASDYDRGDYRGGGRGGGRGRGARGRGRGRGDNNRGSGRDSDRRRGYSASPTTTNNYGNVNTQDVNEFPALT